MTNFIYLMLFVVAGLISSQVSADPQHYIVEIPEMPQDTTDLYAPALLKLILNASKAPEEVIDVNVIVYPFTRARLLNEMQKPNSANKVIWMATSIEYELLLRPIRIPIYKGLLGDRILVIRKEDQKMFSKITNKADLLKLKTGQGKFWIDSDILKINNFPVEEVEDIPTLYKMLRGKRFDYFLRGIFEPAIEGPIIEENDLVVENSLLITYPMAAYFFVNKNNSELAERIEKGWKIILNNGEFDKLFYSYPPIMAVIKDLKMHKRRIIQLVNPYMPPETPLDHPEYWFDISQYEK